MRLAAVTTAALRLRGAVRMRKHKELEALRAQVGKLLRNHALEKELTAEEVFKAMDKSGQGAVSKADLLELLMACADRARNTDPPLSAEKLERVLTHLAENGDRGAEGGIDGETAITLSVFSRLVRVYFKVVSQTVLTDGMGIKGNKTVRRLEEGELLEAEDGPKKEADAGVMRVYARALKDGAMGYVTVEGNQGTIFLVEGGDVFKVARDVDLTSALQVEDGEAVRGLKEGELLRVVEWQRLDEKQGVWRMMVMSCADGARGWATVAGADGVVFLHVA
eukprot:NODE_2180_length_2274_cov_10.467163.p2 GENE.NODE_2180_length_2274_cov_10.467163~~NODE_2180_length_2274_cov_10.467163.p2  ORF type:complete len:279 (+),score=84.57 NODE_2180_length_2274_cov_10.467163:907-1743(+)